MDDVARDESTHITLVHGTFAPGAGWTQAGSALRNAIEKAFSGKVCFHDEFRWSGLPSHIARHVAAKRLQTYLEKLTNEHAGPHYLIGHSHGALVTLYALRDSDLALRIEGVISLSTPYLIARRRQLSILGWIAAVLGCFGIFGLGMSLSRVPLMIFLDSTGPRYLGVAVAVLGIIVQVGLIVALIGLFRWTGKLTDWFLRTMTIPDVHPKRLLVVRGPSDEASALISLFHALELFVTALWGRRGPFDSLITAKATKLIEWLVDIWGRRPKKIMRLLGIWLGIGMAILVGAMFTVLWLSIYRRQQFDLWAVTGWSPGPRKSALWIGYRVFYQFALSAFPTWVLAVLVALAMPAIVVIGTVSTLVSWGLYLGVFLGAFFLLMIGWTALLALASVPELGPCAATMIVAVETSPPGQYPVVHGSDTSTIDVFLTHSWSYTHPVALNSIVEFIATPKPFGEPLAKMPTPSYAPGLPEQIDPYWDWDTS
ncbi:hypothetical protein [Mesorhizobium sp. M0146]|uniref:esterase/lipase family protein n=1 Tax=unclassified Mesorhizobium TaxID=325217 RepID=UPI003338454E